jgi:HJR/Mrr/RecB family endonuclease
MTTYRVLVFDYGHVNACHIVQASTDDDAVKAAQALEFPGHVELWERDRFVARLNPAPPTPRMGFPD